MTDPTPTTPQQDEEQMANFSWWLCMLPFVVGALVFTFMWWQHKAEAGSVNNLMYALGVLIIGMVISGMVNGAAESSGTASGGSTTSSGSTTSGGSDRTT